MSHWLSSVNNLLEKLDDKAEIVAEERWAGDEGGHGGIDDILAKRGLEGFDPEETFEEGHGDDDDDGEGEGTVDIEMQPPEQHKPKQQQEVKDDANHPTMMDTTVAVDGNGSSHSQTKESTVDTTENSDKTENRTQQDGATASKSDTIETRTKVQTNGHVRSNIKSTKTQAAPPKAPPPPPSPVRTAPKSQKERELVTEAKEAQKESRTLRRHVVSLNAQLEAAESELQAQRQELERAAEQMEKDRLRTKEAKESVKKLHTQELTALKEQNEKALKEQQSRFEEQLGSFRQRLADMENQRKQEDGDWSKEMTSVIEREQEVNKRLILLEDEKSVFLSQISTMQGQQAALGSRLESLTQAADNAMDREREAEDRLDAALTQHARQISHRQARESELERTIQELNAALVAKTHQTSRSSSNSLDKKASDASNDNAAAKLENVQHELDTALAHLALERERSEALHQELREMSKESTQEASVVHAKQVQYERKVAELELTVSKLQRERYQKEASGDSSESVPSDNELSNQVKLLSEELMRLREKVSCQNSESLTLKNRLQTAIVRAEKAEEELVMASADGNSIYDSMEKANRPRRRRGGAPPTGSIRTAMHLNAGSGERAEKIGKVVDVVDSFASSTGKYLRKNPLARAGFIFYLLLMHLWTFVLLFFHAHGFELEHADFGAGGGLPHGPHALMQQSVEIQNPATITKATP